MTTEIDIVDRFNSELIEDCAKLTELNTTYQEKLETFHLKTLQLEKLLKIAEDKATVAEEKALVAEEKAEKRQAEAEFNRLRYELLQQKLFGKSSEKRTLTKVKDPNQLTFDFFNETETESAKDDKTETVTVNSHKRKKRKARNNTSRKDKFPDFLPREDILIESDSNTCPCCNNEMNHVIREEVTEKLCCRRDPFYVERYIRQVKACRACEKVGTLSEVPEVFERSCLSESAVSFVLTNKFCFGLPFYRQSQMITSWGIPLSADLLIRHAISASLLLKPVYKSLLKSVKSSDYVLGDETRLRAAILNSEKKKVFKHGYLWGLLNSQQEVAFCFTPARNHKFCSSVFDDYQGVIICDGYDGYESLAKKHEEITLANCNYHARRKWVEAENYNKTISHKALGFYQELSKIEAKCVNLSPAERAAYREKYASPVLEDFKNWILEIHPQEPNKTPVKKAAEYTLKRWEGLTIYVQDGNIPFSTNELERMMKTIAVGRKNFLHAASEVGAEAVAIFYSLAMSCKLSSIDPFIYFSDVLRRVGMHPNREVDKLTPIKWKELYYEEAKTKYQNPIQINNSS